MLRDPKENVRIMLQLKEEYGDLNRALILEHIRAYGKNTVNSLAQDVGLSRSVVERALQEL